MPILYLTPSYYVPTKYAPDFNCAERIKVEISEESYKQVSSGRLYHAWHYHPETGEFIEEPVMTPEMLRGRRELDCFSIIDNRSILWWNSLSGAQKEELNAWYSAWLNVTETLVIPEKPEWLN